MKIQNVQIWQNGQVKTANNFILSIIKDNLETSAIFNYQLLSIIETITSEDTVNTVTEILSYGNLTIEGVDYQTWDASPSANQWAYDWAAGQLNLVLIPE